jgi:hypothetical protein
MVELAFGSLENLNEIFAVVTAFSTFNTGKGPRYSLHRRVGGPRAVCFYGKFCKPDLLKSLKKIL